MLRCACPRQEGNRFVRTIQLALPVLHCMSFNPVLHVLVLSKVCSLVSHALGQTPLKFPPGTSPVRIVKARNIRTWACRNVTKTFEVGTFAVLETLVGESCSYRYGKCLLYKQPGDGQFFSQTRDSSSWRFSALTWLSREKMKYKLMGQGERVNGIPNVSLFLTCRLEDLLGYTERHERDGFLTKQHLCLVPSDIRVLNDVACHDISFVKTLFRNLVSCVT